MPYSRKSFSRKFPKRVTVGKRVAKKAIEKARVTNVKRIVKSVIRADSEVKTASNLLIADQATTKSGGLNASANLGFTTTSSILPLIVRGPNDGERIGNVINTKKLVLRYTLRAIDVTAAGSTNPYPALPFLCRIVVYSQKLDKTDYNNDGLLEIGASSGNLGGTPDTWVEPYNRRKFNIHYSKQYLMQPVRTTFAGAGYLTDQVANGSKQMIVRRVALKGLPKKLMFNDGSGLNDQPTNCGMFLAVAVCNVDGTSISALHQRCMINAETYLIYTDA